MAGDLSTLIRLHKYELDEKKQALAEIYEELAVKNKEKQVIIEKMEFEKSMINNVGEVHFTLSGYIEKVSQQIKAIDAEAMEIEKRAEIAKDKMLDSFSELKKYEMTQAERDRIEEEKQKYKETLELDEIALEGFRRNKE